MHAKLNDLGKIRVAAVSYLNTKPLLYGILRHRVSAQIELIEDYPAKIAQMLIDNEVDIGLIPVAATFKLKEWHTVTDYCIGANGPVASVCIFSEVPIDQIKTVYLDYQSRTSVNLAKVLLREYWQKEVEFLDAKGEDFRQSISGSTAGVIIGDRALEQRQHSPYIYDLAEAWKLHTGLPFVFAAWIANKKLPAEFEQLFNEANSLGFDHIDEIVKQNPFKAFDLKNYYTRCIDYNLDEEKREAMRLFLGKLSGKL